MVTLPESWETFSTAISTFAPTTSITSADVEGHLLTEEVNRKNMEGSKSSNALVVKGHSTRRTMLKGHILGASHVLLSIVANIRICMSLQMFVAFLEFAKVANLTFFFGY